MNQELKSLVLESLREKQDSYAIKELFEKFPTTTELISATEQQLQSVKGIGRGKARQITAMLKLAKALTYQEQSNDSIRSPKYVLNLLDPVLRFEQKEHFICLFLNTVGDDMLCYDHLITFPSRFLDLACVGMIYCYKNYKPNIKTIQQLE